MRERVIYPDRALSLITGRSRVSLVSEKTGVKFDYRIKLPRNARTDRTVWVFLENESAEPVYIGFINTSGRRFTAGRDRILKVDVGAGATSVKALEWALAWLANAQMPPNTEIWETKE